DGDGVVTKLKVKPKTVECGIKAVFASLWNQRAVEERSFARLDHETSGMGISVVPAHDTEGDIVANSVVITRGLNTDDIIAYSLPIQKDNDLVPTPDPGTISEFTLAIFGSETRPPRFTTARFATPKPNVPALKTPVLTEAQMSQMTEIARQVEI